MDRQGSDEKKKLAHDSYTVGWICVLLSELNASRALLDEEHQPLPQTPKDDNSYLLGRMVGHNVVIAFTGSGTYGANAATQTATHLTRTFRKIRFGLMVGVGGGAPKRPDLDDPLKDIRLGDVVVSTAKGSHGGVLQYDMGKWRSENEFHIDSHLNKPPTVLSRAIELLQSHHVFGEGKMTQYINEVATKSTIIPALMEYRFPGRDQDQLYKSDYRHAGGSDCSSCDATKVEKRLRRNSDDPVVHYGLIASGNAIMRSAHRREKLRDVWNVLCFEMEAAGLMDDFPCVVIRGISDYCDDHKHKVWQPYSAVAAAAYAKDLLSVIQPQEVEGLEVAAMIAKFSEAVRTAGETVTRIESTVVKDKDSKILDWLTPIAYGSQYSDHLKVRQLGTCQWFLDSVQYRTWLDTRKQTLFCPGNPGAGKTILASIVVEDLFSRFENDQEFGIAYLYCSYERQEKQKVDDLLASLLRQLAQRRPSLPDELTCLYNKHKDKQTQPSVNEVLSGLQSVVRMYSRVFIIVDALDECETECMSTFLSQLFNLQTSSTANVLATSRPIQTIEKEFEGRSKIVKIRARDEDVEKYLDNNMKTLPLLGKENKGLSEEDKKELWEKARTTIVKSVNGVFLLARLHLASLVDKTTVYELIIALKSLPRGQNALAQAYGMTMARIRSQRTGFRFLAEKVLLLLTCAKRPLTTLELEDGLAVTEGDTTLDKTKRGHTNIIVSVCAGLVTVDADSGIIHLGHETTREYLATHMHCIRPQKAPMTIGEAHRTFAIICVTYLSFSDFDSGFCQTDEAFEERLKSNPLYDYAAHNWGHHAREASTLCPSFIEFLKDSPKVEASSQPLMAVEQGSWFSGYSQRAPRQMTGLHLTAFFGVQEATHELLSRGHDPHLKDTYGQTPLLLAARNGHKGTVKLLLDSSNNVANLKNNDGRTPLSWAAGNGYRDIVKLLLESSYVDADLKDNNGRTPLSWAVENGHDVVIKSLIDTKRVDINSKDERGRTPLNWAGLSSNPSAVMQLLVDEGARLEQCVTVLGHTPLSWCAAKGYEDFVKLLLRAGNLLESTDDIYGRTPLSWAAKNGHEAVVKLLLEENAKLESKDSEYGQTSLSLAAKNGHESVVNLLLEKGADVESQDTEYGWTPLIWAVKNGHEAIAKRLKESMSSRIHRS